MQHGGCSSCCYHNSWQWQATCRSEGLKSFNTNTQKTPEASESEIREREEKPACARSKRSSPLRCSLSLVVLFFSPRESTSVILLFPLIVSLVWLCFRKHVTSPVLQVAYTEIAISDVLQMQFDKPELMSTDSSETYLRTETWICDPLDVKVHKQNHCSPLIPCNCIIAG